MTPPAPSAGPSRTLQLSAEAGASAASTGSLTFAGSGAARLTFGATLAGFFELGGATQRSFELGPGRVFWTRLSAALGGRLRLFETQRFFFEPALSVQLAALPVAGSGFRETASAVVPDLGGCGDLRAGLRTDGALEFFVGLRGCAWPLTPSVRVGGLDLTSALPVFEASLRLGVSYGWLL